MLKIIDVDVNPGNKTHSTVTEVLMENENGKRIGKIFDGKERLKEEDGKTKFIRELEEMDIDMEKTIGKPDSVPLKGAEPIGPTAGNNIKIKEFEGMEIPEEPRGKKNLNKTTKNKK